MSNQEIIAGVMEKIESFYFEDGPDSGEAIFNVFAAKHAHLFEDDFDATGAENKLEFTPLYKEFCEMFESCIESKHIFS